MIKTSHTVERASDRAGVSQHLVQPLIHCLPFLCRRPGMKLPDYVYCPAKNSLSTAPQYFENRSSEIESVPASQACSEPQRDTQLLNLISITT